MRPRRYHVEMTVTATRPAVPATPVNVLPASPGPRELALAELPVVRDLRHDLHQHPELQFEERRTSGVVQRELTALGVEFKSGLAGGTGVLGHIPATVNAGGARTVALRADMDALPIEENTGRGYASRTPGVMHACGHDAHTSMLLGVARVLTKTAHRPNNTLLVFQPAEEGGAGGEKMCLDGVLDGRVLGKPACAIYGLHGWPELPLGQVATRTGPLLASTDEFHVTIKGKGGHAAYPHLCVDPIVIGAQIVTALQTIASRRVGPLDSVVVTVGCFHAGFANNVIPPEATLIGTIRSLRPETRALAEREFRSIVDGVCGAMGASAHIQWTVGYPVTENHPEPTERFRGVARQVVGPERLIEREHPTMGGEDFSFYGQRVPACFFFLGLRPEGTSAYPNLHTAEFDFNDDALPLGVELLARLALADHA